MDLKKILENKRYLSTTDLRFNRKENYNLTSDEVKEFLDYKDNLINEDNNMFFNTNLKSFNSKYIYLYKHDELIEKYNKYIEIVNEELIYDNLNELEMARVYSEVEGSLAIEGINSTRKLYDEIRKGKKPETKNEIIIRNMQNAIEFVNEKKPFNKENLLALYKILSDDSLNEEDMIKDDNYYRDDAVYISNYEGAKVKDIDSLMESLFNFIEKSKKINDPFIRFLIPHIAHYYIIYVHPYFDFNGRTSRMVTLWISNLMNIDNSPYYISEAINETKKEYYKAISRTRDSRNDLTYFLNYILDVSLEYGLCYYKLNRIKEDLKVEGEVLTIKEETYVKKIIMKSHNMYFSWKDYISYIDQDISKQGALKMLNSFEKYNIISSKINSKKEKMFIMNY